MCVGSSPPQLAVFDPGGGTRVNSPAGKVEVTHMPEQIIKQIRPFAKYAVFTESEG